MESDTSATKDAKRSLIQAPQDQPTKRSNKFGWWWETIAILISIAFMAAIVAVLAAIDKKPLPQWSVHFIDGRQVCAALSLAECLGQLKWVYFENRAKPLNHMQVFDGASRGPWGSFLFLLEVKGKAILASLGAVVMILALSFDPFTQLAIDYHVQQDRSTNETGHLSVSRNWQNGYAGNLKDNNADFNLYVPATAGVFNALGNEDYAPSPNYECPSSDCRINDVSMLGICSKCDTQPTLSSNFDNCKVSFLERMANGLNRQPIEYSTYQDFFGALKNLPHVPADYILNMQCEQGYGDFPKVSLSLNATEDTQIHAHLGQQWLIGVYNLLQEVEIVTDDSGVRIIKNGTDDVPNATLKVCFYDTLPKLTNDPTLSLAKASCFSSTTNLTLYTDILKVGQINGTVETCQLQLCEKHYDSISIQSGTKSYTGLMERNLVLDKSEGDKMYARADSNAKTEYNIHYRALLDMRTRFGQVAAVLRNSKDAKDLPDLNLLNSVLKPTNRTNGTALDNFPVLFNRFADVLTSVIQSSGNPDTDNVTMETWVGVTHVHVIWPYMTVPLFIVLFSALFLVISIIGSRNKAYPLKTSSLAVIYHGINASDWVHEPSDAQEGMREKTTEGGLIQGSKKMDVVFIYDEDRMKLKE